MLGMGSSVFHPESSRVARMAAGRRHGLAQSMFQVGGNAGSALGPLAAAIVVVRWGQSSLAFFALLALLSCAILWNVGQWYRNHGLARLGTTKSGGTVRPTLPRGKVLGGIAVLLALIFSKYVYLASLTSYFTFYLIHRFGVSVETAQIYLFVFLGAVAVGTIAGGPYASVFWTVPLTVIFGLILASALPAIVVFAQELVPGKIGMISGLFFGFSFGMGGIGAAVLGNIADRAGIEMVYSLCAYLPAIGLLAIFLPDPRGRKGDS